jgi:hypothetical protein
MKGIYLMLWITIVLVSIFVFQGCFAPYNTHENRRYGDDDYYYDNTGSGSYDGFAPYR